MRVLVSLLAIIVVVGTAWFTVGPGAAAPIGACSRSSTATLPDEPSAVDRLTMRWGAPTPFSSEPELDDVAIVDVEVLGDAFVAVGIASNGPEVRTFFRSSSYGDAWQGAMLDQGLVGTELSRLRVVGERIFALGTTSTDDRGGYRAAIWFSDDGIRWREAAGAFDETTVHAVARDARGLLLIGSRPDSRSPVAWRSADGGAWTEAPLRLPVDAAAATISDLAFADDRWLAVGSVSRGADADSSAVAWTSEDGETWACHVLEDGLELRTSARELHRGPRGWLVVGDASRGCGIGASCPGFQIVWSFVDGAWTAGEAPGAASDAVGAAPMLWNAVYAPTEFGFIGIGGGAWVSETGVRWSQLDTALPAGTATAIAVRGNQIVGGGTTEADGATDAWLAVGHLGGEDPVGR